MVSKDHKVDPACDEDLVLPLNAVRAGVEHLGDPVLRDGLLQSDFPALILIPEECVVDDRGVGTKTPSPLPVVGKSPPSEGGGPPSFLKKSKGLVVHCRSPGLVLHAMLAIIIMAGIHARALNLASRGGISQKKRSPLL
ncbi:hypothetical protein Nepgr_018819 [Nepenthes gracilis]|uniref:Uncharacterized protein n=1 Tax=Nepenthes gracilis TaxID=150966 RepID=A0AAD3XTT9_NEPGR|nr:hypothetical protein Nepgr_018819 [Nepenthes gracilis]